MTGIIFPNVMGTLAPLIQMDQGEKRNAFEMDRIRRQDTLDAEERDAAASLPAAIGGDPAAVAKVTASPKYALPFMQHLEKLDTNQRTKLKEQFEVTGKTAAGILALPDAEQPAAYESAYQNLTAQGYKINLPPKWSPALKNQLQGYAIQVPEYLKMLGDRPTPMGGAPGAPAGGTGDPANAIAGIESGGRYDAVGPVANQKGNRAYGKYQIMDFNVGPWTQEVLGRPMTPQEFLANPQAQDAVFKAKFGQYQQKYGSPEAASRAWFAGEGGMNNPNAKDVLGTSVSDYGTKFAQAYGPGATGPQVAQGDTQPRADASGTPTPPAGADPEVFELKSWLSKAMPGAVPMGVKGKPIRDSQGLLMILKPDGSTGWVDVPKPQQPPAGYRPAGGGLEPIPGGPADPAQAKTMADAKRKAEEKATPQTVTKGMQENLTALKKLDAALEALADPKAKGSVGGVGGTVGAWVPGGSEFLNWVDPDGTKVRALIADIGSLKIHDRSGAAVTAAETPRLRPFIPSVGDSPRVIADKLNNFRAEYEGMLRDSLDYYSEQNGFRPYTPAVDYLNRQPAPAASPTPSPAPAPTPPQQVAPQVAPAPPQSAGPPRIGANGEGYDQVPPGAQYIAPDGTTRTKGGR